MSAFRGTPTFCLIAVVAYGVIFACVVLGVRLSSRLGRMTTLRRAVIVLVTTATYGIVVPTSALVIAWSSGLVLVGKDYRELQTVGVIKYLGYPVWFVKAADGISILGGYHFDRFLMNLLARLVTVLGVTALTHVFVARK